MQALDLRPCRLCGQALDPDLPSACADCLADRPVDQLVGSELVEALRRADLDSPRYGEITRQLHHWWLPRPPKPPKRARKASPKV
jgi:hypothetical protein